MLSKKKKNVWPLATKRALLPPSTSADLTSDMITLLHIIQQKPMFEIMEKKCVQ